MPEPVGPAASRDEERQLAGLLAARISTGMVQLMSRFTGRGPTKARTSVNTNLVVVVFEQTLTKGELNLVRAGQGEGWRASGGPSSGSCARTRSRSSSG